MKKLTLEAYHQLTNGTTLLGVSVTVHLVNHLTIR